ncbi:twin-arginine translocase subunit TatC [Candidatus Hydrogenedentota bacterium]
MGDVQMTFVDHLRELRNRLAVAILAVAAFTILGYVFREQIFAFIKAPLGPVEDKINFQAISLTEGFLSNIRLAVYTGIFLGLPFIFYEGMMFIWPALKPSERRVMGGALAASFTLAYIGIAVAYILIFPLIIPALIDYNLDDVSLVPQIRSFVNFVFKFMIGFALAFQLPVVVVVLVRLGVIEHKWLKKYRKYVIVLVFVAAALLTPPDPVSQLLMAAPLLLLYEVSIWVSAFFAGKKKEV